MRDALLSDFCFLRFKIANKGTMNLLLKILDFRILSGWIKKYKPALSKSDFSWDNSYRLRLVIVLLSVKIGKLFNHNPNLNITKKELKKLFLFATSQTHIIFNGKFYNQIDGVAMGSPLAPILANIFLGFY